ncbi:MAG: HDOD domain-containing protein [Pirellulales bacterium]
MTTLNANSPPTCAALDRLVDRAGELYSLPAVTLEVLDLTSNPQVDLRQLKECIERDPALTAKILRVVNSSLFGLSSSVSDLNQAIALLGCRPLKLLVLGFRLPQGLFQNVTGAMLKRYWHHALAKAVAARLIAERLRGIPADEAFIAALLQDIGMLVMLQGIGDSYVRFLDKVVAEQADLVAMERQVLGFDHTQLSSRTFARWGLPQLLVDAVVMPDRESHLPDAAPPNGDRAATALAAVVELADLYATICVDERPDLWPRLERLATIAGGLSRDALSELGGELQQRVETLAGAMRIELPSERDYAETMARAHTLLSDVAADAAIELARAANIQDRPRGPWRESVSLEEAVSRFEFKFTPIGGNLADVPVEPAPPLASKPSGGAIVGGTSARQEIGALGRQQLENHLAVTVAACRRRRCPLSLLLIEYRTDADSVERDEVAVQRAASARRFVVSAIEQIDHPACRHLEMGGHIFAVILADCDRRCALEAAGQLIRDVNELARASGERDPYAVTLAIGVSSVSLPPKNFPADRLIEGASRCQYGASATGGSSVKSIEIY